MDFTKMRYTFSLQTCLGMAAGLALMGALAMPHEARAQRDIFLWEVSGYGALLTTNLDLDVPDKGSRWASGVRIQRNVGAAWQLGLHTAHQNFVSDEEVSYGGLSLTYHWDNGRLLKKRAFISPYHTLDGGYMARVDFDGLSTSDEVGAIGIENGLKLRLGDRVTGSVAYGLFWQMGGDDFTSNFDRSHFNMWKVGLSVHLGARKVNYRGPTFDAAAYFVDQRPTTAATKPVLQLGIEPLPVDDLPSNTVLRTPPDTLLAKSEAEISPAKIDTVYLSRTDTIFLVKRDSAYYRDTTGAVRYTLPPRDTLYDALMDRIVRLESMLRERPESDTMYVAAAKTAPAEEEASKQRAPTTEYQQPEKRDAEPKSAPAQADPKSEYVTDPAVVELLRRQEALIASQNDILREMQRSQAQMTVQTEAGRQPRVRTQVAPTVMVPLNDPGRSRDEERIAALETEIALLKAQMAGTAAAPAATTMEDSVRALPVVSAVVDTALFESAMDTVQPPVSVTSLDRDSLEARVALLNQRADSIAASVAQPAPPAAPVAAEETETAPPTLKASYPATFLFGLNRDDVDNTYDDTFDQIAADLQAFPDKVARITGYTDRSGNVEYNRQLSKRRATSIKRHLVERGVNPDRVILSGEGAASATDKWSPGDRRVEVELTNR